MALSSIEVSLGLRTGRDDTSKKPLPTVADNCSPRRLFRSGQKAGTDLQDPTSQIPKPAAGPNFTRLTSIIRRLRRRE